MNENNKKNRVLLVDDEEDFLTASSQALQRRGLEVDVAPNGVTALELVDAKQYDVIVLDVKMPDIDGIEVFRIIRRKYPNLPVILLTGHSSADDAFQTSKDGIADYLSKPIDMDDMAARIGEVVLKFKQRESEDHEPPPPDSSVPVRVILIDDEVRFLDSMKRVLERRNLDVDTAESGEQGLTLLKEKLVDVVVLDIKMPGLGGLEVLRRIKTYYPSVQVIMLTGHPSYVTAMEAIKQGAHEYLEKPPDIEKLAATIRRLFEYRQSQIQQQQAELVKDIRRRYPD